MLSGECRFMRHFFGEGRYKLVKQFQVCVRERATLSLKSRPQIRDEEHAKEVINSVWESCFNDTRPFDEIYR
jgi:inner membrane protease ATP23